MKAISWTSWLLNRNQKRETIVFNESKPRLTPAQLSQSMLSIVAAAPAGGVESVLGKQWRKTSVKGQLQGAPVTQETVQAQSHH